MSNNTSESEPGAGMGGLVPPQLVRRPNGIPEPCGVPFLGEVSPAGWVLSRLSMLPGADLQGLTLEVFGGGKVQVQVHDNDAESACRVALTLGFGTQASVRGNFPRGHGLEAFSAFVWRSSPACGGVSLVWYTTPRAADLAVAWGVVTLPPAPAA